MNLGLTDPSSTAAIKHIDAWRALVADRHDDAFAVAMEVCESPSMLASGLFVASRAAMAARNVEQAQATLARLDAAGLHGPAIEAQRRTMQAGIAAVGGRRGDAALAFRDAAGMWRDLGLRFDLAICQLDLVTHAATTDRERAPAAEEARTIFTELGAVPFLARLDAVTSAGPAHTASEPTTKPPVEKLERVSRA